jgi:hypothetical protein
MSFETISDYGYVMLVCAFIALEIIVIGFVLPMSKRRKIFSQEWMKENF